MPTPEQITIRRMGLVYVSDGVSGIRAGKLEDYRHGKRLGQASVRAQRTVARLLEQLGAA